MSSVYPPRRTLCVPDNAYSLAVTSTEIVVGTSEGEKLFNSGLMIMMAKPLTDEEIADLAAYLKDAKYEVNN